MEERRDNQLAEKRISKATLDAKGIIDLAEVTASNLRNSAKQENRTDELIDILQKNIDEDKDSKMSAIVGRIPILCQSVLDIHIILKEIKEGQKEVTTKLDEKFVKKDGEYSIIKSIVFGASSLILVAVFSAIVYLVVQK